MTELARTSSFKTAIRINEQHDRLPCATTTTKESRRRMFARRGLIVVALLVAAALEGDNGYRHFMSDRVEPNTGPHEDVGSIAAAPFTGYTDALWVNGWSGPHLDR